MLKLRCIRMRSSTRATLVATAMLCACGTSPPPVAISEPSLVHAAPSPARLLALVVVELQDSLAGAPSYGACVTKVAPLPEAIDAIPQAPKSGPGTTWHYDACQAGSGNTQLSGERQLWMRDDAAGMQRSRFALARSRSDGALWQAAGQTDMSLRSDRGGMTEQRALAHGTMTMSGGPLEADAQHAYAYHLRLTEGLDGVAALRISGVAQLNFEVLLATTQVKLSSLISTPLCPWPTSGHVSIATTASDGSVLDATLMFTPACGVVEDAQGGLTTLVMPWEVGL